jgi:glycosyltransferase involved in cell wall biosynthesis
MHGKNKELATATFRKERTLSIIIPAWNEEKKLSTNIKKVEETLDAISENHGFSYEIIIVNDGSTDNTFKEALKVAKQDRRVKVITYTLNGGKGKALKYGFKFCTGRLVTFLDADLDIHPSQILQLLTYMEKYNADVVVGSKRHPESKIKYPFSRKILSQGYHFLAQLLFKLGMSDTQAGLKLFKYEVLQGIFPKILCKRYAFDLELLVNVHRNGWKIVEAPIKLDWQRLGNRLTLRDIWQLLLDTAAIYYRLHIIHYYDIGRATFLFPSRLYTILYNVMKK